MTRIPLLTYTHLFKPIPLMLVTYAYVKAS